MAKQTMKGVVEKVVRQNGKQDAQVTITVAANLVQDIPLGSVSLTIETLQSALFGNKDVKKK